MKRIKAFTLMELTVVMVVSGILLTLIFKGFDLLNTFYFAQKDEVQEEIVMAQWLTTFQKDLLDARELSSNSNELTLTSLERKVKYLFLKDRISRVYLNGIHDFSIYNVKHKVLGDSVVCLNLEGQEYNFYLLRDLASRINTTKQYE